jgi:CRISPR-associated protein Cas2
MDRPTKANSQTTCYVIAYDIPDDRRRTKVHDLLLGYGAWMQYSLFECFLTDKELLRLQAKLAKLLVAKEDSVRVYPLCARCVSKVATIGGPRPTETVVYVV